MNGKVHFLLLVLFGLGFSQGRAQFTLDEIGLGVGAGSSILTGTPTQVGYGANIQAYYSHYFCGKRTGFHTVAGIRWSGMGFSRSFSTLDSPNAEMDNSVKQAFLDLGFMGKIRKNEYHRSREAALMVGPKVNMNLLSLYSDSAGSGSFSSIPANAPFFNVGIHASVQFRRKFGKNAWFFRPGGEYYLLPVVSNTAAGSFRNVYLFLMFEINLWDAKG
jgi:hypothetical protein